MYTVIDRTNFIEVTLDSKVLRAMPKKKIECVAEGDYVVIKERGQGESAPERFKILYSQCSAPSRASAALLTTAINALINS